MNFVALYNREHRQRPKQACSALALLVGLIVLAAAAPAQAGPLCSQIFTPLEKRQWNRSEFLAQTDLRLKKAKLIQSEDVGESQLCGAISVVNGLTGILQSHGEKISSETSIEGLLKLRTKLRTKSRFDFTSGMMVYELREFMRAFLKQMKPSAKIRTTSRDLLMADQVLNFSDFVWAPNKLIVIQTSFTKQGEPYSYEHFMLVTHSSADGHVIEISDPFDPATKVRGRLKAGAHADDRFTLHLEKDLANFPHSTIEVGGFVSATVDLSSGI